MSLMDKIKGFFSGGSSGGDDHDHDHAGHDHSGHDHSHEEEAAPVLPPEPTGMAEPMQPAEPAGAEPRDDL